MQAPQKVAAPHSEHLDSTKECILSVDALFLLSDCVGDALKKTKKFDTTIHRFSDIVQSAFNVNYVRLEAIESVNKPAINLEDVMRRHTGGATNNALVLELYDAV